MKKFKVQYEGDSYGVKIETVCANDASHAYQIIVNKHQGDVHTIYNIEEVK